MFTSVSLSLEEENAFDGEGGVNDDDADLGELGEDDVEEEVEFEEGEDEDEDVSTPEETETT